jgi:hypothetical protein
VCVRERERERESENITANEGRGKRMYHKSCIGYSILMHIVKHQKATNKWPEVNSLFTKSQQHQAPTCASMIYLTEIALLFKNITLVLYN